LSTLLRFRLTIVCSAPASSTKRTKLNEAPKAFLDYIPYISRQISTNVLSNDHTSEMQQNGLEDVRQCHSLV
jgi:hypothetical protein